METEGRLVRGPETSPGPVDSEWESCRVGGHGFRRGCGVGRCVDRGGRVMMSCKLKHIYK